MLLEIGKEYNPKPSDGNLARISKDRSMLLPIVKLSLCLCMNENKVLLEWTTADNEERGLYTVQRSVDAVNWIDLQTIPGDISFTTKKYYYTDYVSNANCRFYYRIKMKLASGVSLYTRIVFTDVRTKDGFTLFPNPARSEVYISHVGLDKLNLFSINGKELKVNMEKVNNDQVKINTSPLLKGIYVVKAGDKQKQLLIQ